MLKSLMVKYNALVFSPQHQGVKRPILLTDGEVLGHREAGSAYKVILFSL